MRQRPSPNHGPRPDGTPIDMLVLHYTGMTSAREALDRLCDADAKVSSHYVIEEDGMVWRLVDESQRAWHAGVSYWRGQRDVNSRSIGIEIVNPGHEWGYRPFPDEQIAAVIELCQGILSRWPIPQNRIVAHSDIAPERKEDPGELFPWKRLSEAGIGLWPRPQRPEPWMMHGASIGDAGVTVERLQQALAAIGYKIEVTGRFDEATAAVIRAFQRRWRPVRVTGEGDAETIALAAAVAGLAAQN